MDVRMGKWFVFALRGAGLLTVTMVMKVMKVMTVMKAERTGTLGKTERGGMGEGGQEEQEQRRKALERAAPLHSVPVPSVLGSLVNFVHTTEPYCV